MPESNMRYKRYQAAFNAIKRCTDNTYPRYYGYGGRGIFVLFNSIKEFVEHLCTLPGWDDPNLVLDRENNDGHYVAGNLRFVTRSESVRNRRKCKPYAISYSTELSSARELAGLSQNDVAVALSLSRITVRRFERGDIISVTNFQILDEYYTKLSDSCRRRQAEAQGPASRSSD